MTQRSEQSLQQDTQAAFRPLLMRIVGTFAATIVLALIALGSLEWSDNAPAIPSIAMILLLGLTAYALRASSRRVRQLSQGVNNALQAREQLLMQYVENTPAAVAMLDRNLCYMAVSPRWMTEYNLTGQSIIGRPHNETITDLEPRWMLVLERCLTGAVAKCDEDPWLRADGSQEWLRWEARPWLNSDGSIGGIVLYAEIITERKRTAFALRDAMILQQAIFDGADHTIIATTVDGIIRIFNQAAEKLLGYDAAEMVYEKNAISLHDPEEISQRATELSIDTGFATLVAAAQSGVSEEREWSYIRKDGSHVPMLISCSALHDSTGVLNGFLMIGSDITERKAAQTAIIKAQKAIEAASQAKTEFLANVSHEIRTPMTSIIGYADLLLDPKISAEDRIGHVQTIRRNGEQLVGIIHDILDIARIEAGGMVVEEVDASPSQILADITSLTQVKAKKKNIVFDVEFDGPIPAKIKTDPARLRQVLLHLVSNAVKFTEAGGLRIITEFQKDKQGVGFLCFRIVDTGIGMTAEQVGEVFEPFKQADTSATRRFGGIGLGLTVSNRLAQLMGGRIIVKSEKGVGSEFILKIPTGPVDETQFISRPAEIIRQGEESKSESPKALNIKILLAEDGIDNQKLISLHLRHAGAQVTIAENGKIALEAALSPANSFNVILMDMQMPVMDGYEATARLRAAGYIRPIIALTAHALDVDRARCLAAGCDEHLVKPINAGLLISTVANFAKEAGELPVPKIAVEPPAEPSSPAAPVEPAPSQHQSELANDPDMQQLVQDYVAGLPTQVKMLQDLLQANDLKELGRLAHQLKGAGGGYGFPQITKLAAAADRLIKQGEPFESISRQVDELVGYVRGIAGYDLTLEAAHVADSAGH
jgi:PAS domain S-box-containing protein